MAIIRIEREQGGRNEKYQNKTYHVRSSINYMYRDTRIGRHLYHEQQQRKQSGVE